MPDFTIRTVNSGFSTTTQVDDLEQPQDALAVGVRAAAAMAAEEIHRGLDVSGVEVSVDDVDGRPLLKSVVVVSVAPLLIG